jgi:hypothetical protein
MKNPNSNASKATVGDGATIQHWSDSTAATVVQVSASGKRIVLQEDKATRLDKNGMSESQEYSYEPDTNGTLHFATLRQDGRYRITGSKRLVSLGIRRKYHDYSF